jgi:Cu(I)/Ag(I) efflux system membrane fusion protein
MQNLFRCCLNPKVIGALVFVGIGVFLLAPGAASSVLPLLLVAVCPLSMLLMGGVMMRSQRGQEAIAGDSYYCPMHPEVTSDTEGRCPRCGMALVKGAGSSTRSQENTVQEEVGRLRAEVRDLREQLADGKSGLGSAKPKVETRATPTNQGR